MLEILCLAPNEQTMRVTLSLRWLCKKRNTRADTEITKLWLVKKADIRMNTTK